MDLEVIVRRPAGVARTPPLLLVHGAYSGAWVWEPHVLDAFAAAGWEAHALSLRGHGGSGGRERLMVARLADYVDDVMAVAARLAAPPVLIGHSMGGLVVQHCLARGSFPAAVLLASPPPHGLLGCWITMAVARPWLLWQLWLLETFGPDAVDLRVVKRALFSDALPDAEFARLLVRFDRESPMAVADMLAFDLPPSRPRGDVPVLVLAAENDPLVPLGAARETARAFATALEVIPGSGHAMMLDGRWPALVERILGWLDPVATGAARPARLAAQAAPRPPASAMAGPAVGLP